MSIFKNSEGYSDPTAGVALAHIDSEERLEEIKRKISNLANRNKNQDAIRKMMILTQRNKQVSEQCLG